jgi:hypothetical protein
MACSWNPEMIERVGRVTAEEVVPTGIHWTFLSCALPHPRPALGPRGRDLWRRPLSDRRIRRCPHPRLPGQRSR